MKSATPKQQSRQAKNEIALATAKISAMADANQAPTNAQMLLEALFENIPDRIYFKDTKSRFIKASKALALRLGLKNPNDAIGKTDYDFFPPEKAREFFEDEQKIIQSGQPLINKVEKQVLANGESGWASTTKVPLRDRNGVIVGIVGINRDITALKNAEQKIETIN